VIEFETEAEGLKNEIACPYFPVVYEFVPLIFVAERSPVYGAVVPSNVNPRTGALMPIATF
jgi:hypothetical protein